MEGRTYCKVIYTTAKAQQIECDVSNHNDLRTTIISTWWISEQTTGC